MCRPRINPVRTAFAAALIGVTLAGCSEHLVGDSLYADRRETISPLAGDAIAANRIAQTIDPWSPASERRTITYSGEKMQTANERYRTGRVIPPVNATTSSVSYSQAQQAAQSAASGQAASAPGAAAVK